MYGGTCLARRNVLNPPYEYMYSPRLRSDSKKSIGKKELHSTYSETNKVIMQGITFFYDEKTGNSAMDLKQLENLNRLCEIKELEVDWNGYGSKPINKIALQKSIDIVKSILDQPKIYPTGRESIQMQYELEDRSYLEFEIFEEKIVCMKVPQRIYSKATFEVLENVDMDVINRIVREFYGR